MGRRSQSDQEFIINVGSLTDMGTPAPLGTTSFSRQAAKLSWVCPLLVFALLTLSRQIGVRVIIELLSLLFIVVGLVFGVVALFGIRTHGKTGILAPASVGIIINGLLLFIFVTNFMAARARAQQQRSDVPAPIWQTNESSVVDRTATYACK